MTITTFIIEHSVPAPAGAAGNARNSSRCILLSRCFQRNTCPTINAQFLIGEDQLYRNKSFYIFQENFVKNY